MQKSENNQTNQPEDSIGRRYGKLQQLVKQHETIQKENERYKKNIEDLNKKQEEFRLNIDAMEQQNLLLKASLSTMSDDDKKALEHKLNTYMRSIDKCISLLSK